MSDDGELVAQARLGDGRAFTELLRRHDNNMRGVAWRLVASRSEMDDVLQDAYLKAWRGLGSFRGESAFSSWLYRIVPLEDLGDQAIEDSTAALADSFELRAALAELPADQFAVVALVDGQGESYEEVAALLGISPGTVGSRLSRARAALRRQLQNSDEDNTQGGRR